MPNGSQTKTFYWDFSIQSNCDEYLARVQGGKGEWHHSGPSVGRRGPHSVQVCSTVAWRPLEFHGAGAHAARQQCSGTAGLHEDHEDMGVGRPQLQWRGQFTWTSASSFSFCASACKEKKVKQAPTQRGSFTNDFVNCGNKLQSTTTFWRLVISLSMHSQKSGAYNSSW